MRGLRGIVVALIVALPVALAAPAQAHALLESSLPADGASYDRAPTKLQLTFSENVTLDATSIQLVDGAGRPIDLERPSSPGGASDTTVLSVPLPALAPDRYLVRWQTISSDDLHPTAGSFVFGIGTEVNPSDAEITSGWDRFGGAVEALLRWLALLALGGALAARAISHRLQRSGIDRDGVLPVGAVRMAAVGTAASVALGLLYLGRIASIAGLIPLASAWPFTIRWVVAWASAAVAWILLRGERRSGRSVSAALPMVLIAMAIVAVTSVGHPFAEGWVGGVLGAVHSVSTLLWACGAGVVAVVAVPALRRQDRARATRVARAFTPIALVSVPISVITGLLLAGLLLPSVGALLSTDYGHALLIKMAVLALGLALAAGTVLFLVSGRGRHRWSMIVAAEAAALGVVVLAASWTASTHPASPVVWGPSPERLPTVGMLSAIEDDLVLTMDVGPGRPGRNFLTIGVLDTRRPAPAPVTTVDVAIGQEPPLTAVPQGDGQWVAAASLPNAGATALRVTVQRSGERTVTAPFTWVIAPPTGTLLGGSELSPLTRMAALIASAATLVLLTVLGGIRRRRHVRSRDRTRDRDRASVSMDV